MRGAPKVGYVVDLQTKSPDNPNMIITKVDEKKDEVTTAWFSTDKCLQVATLPSAVVEKVPDPPKKK